MRFLFLLLVSFPLHAAKTTKVQKFQLSNLETKVLDTIARDFEIVNTFSNGYEVYVPESKVQGFLEIAPSATIDPNYGKNFIGYSDDGYRTYESVETELKGLQAQYPHLAKLEIYGVTESGHNLYVLKISDNVSTDEDEPELMITSATHGDEIATVEIEMGLINLLLENYEKDPRVAKMLNEKEIFFIPMVNPQGYSERQRWAGEVDPNRDYPYPQDPLHETGDCIGPLLKWFHSRDIKGSVDFHTFGNFIMYPWGYRRDLPGSDTSTFQYLTNSMAESNKYEAGQLSRFMNKVQGSSIDYYYWKKKTLALGIELQVPSTAAAISMMPFYVEKNREMVWRFIENF